MGDLVRLFVELVVRSSVCMRQVSASRRRYSRSSLEDRGVSELAVLSDGW